MTDFRAALKARLTTIFTADNVQWVDGVLEGPNNTRFEMGCLFPAREEESEDTSYVTVTMSVRMFKRLGGATARTQDPAKALDPTPLETWAEAMRSGLDDIQALAGGTWFFRVSAIEYDLDEQYALEATVTGWTANPFQTF